MAHKVLYSISFSLYNGVRPVVGINHAIFFLVMQAKIGNITSYAAAFGGVTHQRWYVTCTR